MDWAFVLALAGAVWWAASSIIHVGSIVTMFVQPQLRRWRAVHREQPPVSIIIPVRRLEAGAEAAFSSAFDQTYPHFEVLVSAREESSAALDLARQVAARFPEIEARVLNRNVQFTRNPKVSNLAPAIEAAAHDLILIKDSNIRLQREQLSELVSYLRPGVGMVCAVPIAIGPIGFAAEVERAILNGRWAPLIFAASLIRLNVGFGKVMLFERRNFYRAGGVGVIADTFGDDHALAKALSRLGLRTVFAGGAAHQLLARRSLRAVGDRQLRWLVIRRFEEPLALLAEPIFSCVFSAAAGALAAPLFGAPAWFAAVATPIVWLTAESVALAAKGWGWSWRYIPAALYGEVMMPVLWLRSWFCRDVRWAGLDFTVTHRSAETGHPSAARETSGLS